MLPTSFLFYLSDLKGYFHYRHSSSLNQAHKIILPHCFSTTWRKSVGTREIVKIQPSTIILMRTRSQFVSPLTNHRPLGTPRHSWEGILGRENKTITKQLVIPHKRLLHWNPTAEFCAVINGLGQYISINFYFSFVFFSKRIGTSLWLWYALYKNGSLLLLYRSFEFEKHFAVLQLVNCKTAKWHGYEIELQTCSVLTLQSTAHGETSK